MVDTVVIFDTTETVVQEPGDVEVTLPANAEPIIILSDDEATPVIIAGGGGPTVVLESVGVRGPIGLLPDILGSANFIIDGGNRPIQVIGDGGKGDLDIPFECEIIKAKLFADQPGTIHLDIWRVAAGQWPPTIADSLTNGVGFGLTATDFDDDLDISGWVTGLSQDDTLHYVVVSNNALITRVTVALSLHRPQG